MGQKVNPIGLRLGIIRGWDSSWYGGVNYGDKIQEDAKIRKYLKVRLPKGGMAKIQIERTLKRITITIHTARPGIVIGKGGQEVDTIREEIKKFTGKDIQININEIKRPELDAHLVAENIAMQIENRFAYKRAIKNSMQSTMKMGADGIKCRISGRLNGAEMARSEIYKQGRTPLHTLRSNIDYALVEAMTVYGLIGIKVWICKGEIYGKVNLVPDTEDRRESGNNRGDRKGGNRGGGRDRGPRNDRGDRGGDRGNRGGGRDFRNRK